jgi:hypothetical protein
VVPKALPCLRLEYNIVKYDSKTNPSVWLVVYCIACRVGGADDDIFIIQYLPHLDSRLD